MVPAVRHFPLIVQKMRREPHLLLVSTIFGTVLNPATLVFVKLEELNFSDTFH